MPFHPGDGGEPDGRMTENGWRPWSDAPGKFDRRPDSRRWGFWDVEHWCGPSYEERQRRDLHWDDTRKWRWCPACHLSMSMELADDIGPAICDYHDVEMFCILLAGHDGKRLGYDKE